MPDHKLKLPASCKVFDTRTLAGLKAAERFKAMLESKGYRLTVVPVGLNRVMVSGVRDRAN